MRARVILHPGKTLINSGEVSSNGSYLAVLDPFLDHYWLKTALLGMFSGYHPGACAVEGHEYGYTGMPTGWVPAWTSIYEGLGQYRGGVA